MNRNRLGVWLSTLLVFCACFSSALAQGSSPTPNQKLLIGGDDDSPPYEFLDPKGHPTGFNVDLAEAIARVMGLDVGIHLERGDRLKEALRKGRIGMLMDVPYSPQLEWATSNPVNDNVGYAMFIRKKDASIHLEGDLAGKRVVVQRDAMILEYALNHLPSCRLTLMDSPYDSIRALASGNYDCSLQIKMQGYYLIKKYHLSNVVAVGPPVMEVKINYAMLKKKSNFAFLDRFSEGIRIIRQTGEYQKIYDKWFEDLTPKSILPGTIFKYFVWFLIPLLLALAGSAAWSWSLRKQVAQKTSDLRSELIERKHAQEALRESEQRYRSLVDNIDLGISLIDADYTVVMTNAAHSRLFNQPASAFLGKPCYRIFSKNGAESCPNCPGKEALASGRRVDRELEIPAGDGTPLPLMVRAFPIVDPKGKATGFIEVIEDISARKRMEREQLKLEAQIQNTQKLESLGILAGGIAHDFNNLLMGILGNAELAIEDLTPQSPAYHSLEEIIKAGIRASELTKQMLAYSGKGKFVVEPVNLNELIEEMAHLLKVSISKKVAIQFDFLKKIPLIEADVTQLRQVIMNLITNASDAIGDHTGKITITTGITNIDRHYLAQTYLNDNLPDGRYVFVKVADTGCGMDEQTRARIFDPFYTTKFTGRGLGLAAVLGIMRGHRGAIKVESASGQGTTFKVLFPCPPQALQAPAKPKTGEPREWTGSGVILVVDDEPVVRTVARAMLDRFGFTVIEARDGAEGVARLRQQAGEIDLVLLDMTMPRMNGAEAYQAMKKIKPTLRVILTSGYNEQDVTAQFADQRLTSFVQKPFQLATLAEKVRELLGREA